MPKTASRKEVCIYRHGVYFRRAIVFSSLRSLTQHLSLMCDLAWVPRLDIMFLRSVIQKHVRLSSQDVLGVCFLRFLGEDIAG